DPQDARRFYLNQVTHASDSWLSQPEWAARRLLNARPPKGTAVTLGFDGSRRRSHVTTDATALIGCTVEGGHIFEIQVWEEPDNDAEWQVPIVEVDAAVRTAFNDWD